MCVYGTEKMYATGALTQWPTVHVLQALEHYRQLLTYTKSAVTRNYGEKGVNTILDAVSSMTDLACMERFYKVTLDALLEAKNEVGQWSNSSGKENVVVADCGV